MTKVSFGTDGWRAVMCDEFTLLNVKIVAQGIAEYLLESDLRKNGVIVGHDTRFFAEEFAQACASVFAENKIPVYLAKRPLPTPVVAHAIVQLQLAGAVMLTASHNPFKYNGIKFIPDYAGPATSEITRKIEKNIAQTKENLFLSKEIKESKEVNYINPIPEYIEHLSTLVDFDLIAKAKLKVVADPLYGAGYGLLDEILKRAGCEVYAIHNQRDVMFGGLSPDPSIKHLNKLGYMVKKMKAHLGVALDGDGDRFGVVDSVGVYLSPNQVLTLLSEYLLGVRKLKGSLVRTVATTHALDTIASNYNTQAIEVPVGFKYVGQVMRERPVVLGGEESGGLSILNHIPEKDGILADLLLCEVTARLGRPLSNILDEIYAKYGCFQSERLDIYFPQEKKEDLLKSLKNNPPNEVAGVKVEKVLTIDGVKILFSDNSWMLIRPSGTEPLVRAYIEAAAEERFEALKRYTKSMLSF